MSESSDTDNKDMKTLTENCAPTFSTSSDARVDFFFHITEDADETKTIDLLSKSWECHPLDTLKLIAYLRDCRNGKGIRRQYQMCMNWLYNNHFQTLSANIKHLVSFGYWKDLLHLLIVFLFDGLIPEYMAKDDGHKKIKSFGRRGIRGICNKGFPLYDRIVLRTLRRERQQQQQKAIKMAKKFEKLDLKKSEDIEIECDSEKSIEKEVIYTVPTRAEVLENSRRSFAQKRYNSDHKYRSLYDKIVEIFAKQLNSDLEGMAKNVSSISLAGKWAPTNRHHFDKYLFISGEIGKYLCRLMKKDDMINNSSLVSDFYQKEVCSPLRKYLNIPEVYMSAKLWSEVDYNRVASKCMQKNKSLFIKYDSKRFEEFLASKKTISGAVLKPVELVSRGFEILDKLFAEDFEEKEEGIEEGEKAKRLKESNDLRLEKIVIEKQWLSMTEDILKKGISSRF